MRFTVIHVSLQHKIFMVERQFRRATWSNETCLTVNSGLSSDMRMGIIHHVEMAFP